MNQESNGTFPADVPECTNKCASAVSERRRRASQENGKLSRGPKTEHGKSRSRMNARKHDMSAMLVNHPRSGEGVEDFKKLLKELHDDFHPEGIYEESLVMRIAHNVCYRLPRAARYETGVLEMEALNHDLQMPPLVINYGELDLKEAEKEVRKHGYISEDTIKSLTRFKTIRGDVFAMNDQAVEAARAGATKSPIQDNLVALLRSEQSSARTYEAVIGGTNTRRTASTFKMLALPDDSTMDRVFRYEREIRRQITRDLAELERAQERREACERRKGKN